MGLKHEILDGFLEEVVFQQRTEQWIRISRVRRRKPGWIRALRQEGVGWIQESEKSEMFEACKVQGEPERIS